MWKKTLIVWSCLLSLTAQAAEVSLLFTEGYLGTQGSNTNQVNSIKKFSTLGIVRAGFFQTDANNDGRFGDGQGNDLAGTIKLFLSSGTIISLDGAINFRETTGSTVEVFGFIFTSGQNATISYGSGQTFSIVGGSTASTSTSLGLKAYTSSFTFTDNTNRSGNAATSNLLSSLNTALENSPQPSTVTLTNSSVTEGTSLQYTATLTATTTFSQVFSFATSGTATGGSDYSTSYSFSNGVTNNGDGTITVPTSVSSFTITVSTTDDASVESAETVIIGIGVKSGTGTINDNDVAPNTTIASSPAANSNSSTGTFTFTSDKSPVTFECALDSGSYASCSSTFTTGSLPDGSHTLSVRAIDSGSNVDPSPATYTWTIDTDPPETTIDSKPGLVSNSSSGTFGFSSDESPVTYVCALDLASVPCSSSFNTGSLSDGSHTLSVQAKDAAGNLDPSAATYTWTIDTDPPDTSITSKPAAVTSITTGSFTFGSDESPVTYACTLDLVSFSCPSSYTTGVLSNGSHTLSVAATDSAGNTDPSPATYTWTVDNSPPDTAIVTKPAAVSNSSSAAFTFASDESPVTYECSVDSGAYASCGSSLSLSSLMDGSHTLSVRATDIAGNTDATPANYTWTIDTSVSDTTPPDTTILTKPASLTNSSSASFSFGSDESPVTYECSVDSGAYAACGSSLSLSSLIDGSHTLSVRAKDSASNTDPSPATYTWVIDTSVPDTSIVTKPAALTNSNSASFTFSSDQSPVTYECSVDSSPYASCGSSLSLPSLLDGSHSISVRATDAAGNTDASPATYTWVIDTSVPDTSIVTKPAALTSSNSASFTFSSDQSPVTYECAVDLASTPCSSALSLSNLSDGTHTIEVAARDLVGNIDPSPATYTWVIDNSPPDTTIVTKPPPISNSSSASFSFGSNESPVTYDCMLDGNTISCNQALSLTGLSDGNHTLEVRATDEAGNTDLTSAIYNWRIDTNPPDTFIVSSPASKTQSTTAQFDFDSDESPVTYECSLNGSSYAPCADPETLSGLADQSHTLSVRAIDEAGNIDGSPATHNWTIDTVEPDTFLTHHPKSKTGQTSATFDFDSNEPSAQFECSLDGAPFQPCTSGIQFQSLSTGPHQFLVRAIDPAGNVDSTPASWNWVVQVDADDDGLADDEEAALRTEVDDADTDDDGVLDGEEKDALQDSDGDGLVNALDPDSDNDGLFDGTESGITSAHADTDVSRNFFVADLDPASKTDPTLADTDSGGVADGSEDSNRNGRIDPNEQDPNLKADDTLVADDDNDGLSNALEAAIGSLPNDADTDDDGVLDGKEAKFLLDLDNDGLINVLDPDSDNDLLFDGTESGITQPSAGTNVSAGFFVKDEDPSTVTSPVLPDTDWGGVPDGAEDANRNGRVDEGEKDPRFEVDDAEVSLNLGADNDQDGVPDMVDLCPNSSDPQQADLDGDGIGDNCDVDADNNGFEDTVNFQGGRLVGCSSVPGGSTAGLLWLVASFGFWARSRRGRRREEGR